jgi:hypothetical protein
VTGAKGATGASGPGGSNTVTVVTSTANTTAVTAVCAAGSHAVGGGGTAAGITITGGNASNMQGTFPSDAAGNLAATGTTNPPAWTSVYFKADPSNTATALCAPN